MPGIPAGRQAMSRCQLAPHALRQSSARSDRKTSALHWKVARPSCNGWQLCRLGVTSLTQTVCGQKDAEGAACTPHPSPHPAPRTPSRSASPIACVPFPTLPHFSAPHPTVPISPSNAPRPRPRTHWAPQAGAQLWEGTGPSQGSRAHGGLRAPRILGPTEAGQQPRSAAYGVGVGLRRLLVPREGGRCQKQAQRQGGSHQLRELGHEDGAAPASGLGAAAAVAGAPYICGGDGAGRE